jgi:hypothetical protein
LRNRRNWTGERICCACCRMGFWLLRSGGSFPDSLLHTCPRMLIGASAYSQTRHQPACQSLASRAGRQALARTLRINFSKRRRSQMNSAIGSFHFHYSPRLYLLTLDKLFKERGQAMGSFDVHYSPPLYLLLRINFSKRDALRPRVQACPP